MSSSIDKFNVLMMEFLNKIVNKFPGEWEGISKLKKYILWGSILIKTDPIKCSYFFMRGCECYKHQIENRDESFFIGSPDINCEANKYGASFTSECGFSFYWGQFSETSKVAIWDYIQSLYILGDLIIATDPNRFNKFNNEYKTTISNE